MANKQKWLRTPLDDYYEGFRAVGKDLGRIARQHEMWRAEALRIIKEENKDGQMPTGPELEARMNEVVEEIKKEEEENNPSPPEQDGNTFG